MGLFSKIAGVFRRKETVRLTDTVFWRNWLRSDSYSGKSVTVDTALQVSTAWACVRLISETIATLPMVLYERGQDSTREPARNHALYPILHDSPDGRLSAVEFWEQVGAGLCLWGNFYAEIVRAGAGGRVVALNILCPELMTVRREPDATITYQYDDPTKRRELREDQVFHVRGFGTGSGIMGLSPVAYSRQSLGSSMAAEETAARTFANGLSPGGALTMDQILKPEQRKQIRENLAAQLAGSVHAGKLMVLEAGMKYEQLSMNPGDAQLLETRRFGVEEICRWYRVPPFMVGHTEKSTSWGTGLSEQTGAYLKYTLRPYLGRIEGAIHRSLLRPGERGRYYAEFNIEGLLRADSAARAEYYSTMVQNGIYTRNEVRRKENLPPVVGGDELTAQSNLVPLDQLGAVAQQGTGPTEGDGDNES